MRTVCLKIAAFGIAVLVLLALTPTRMAPESAPRLPPTARERAVLAIKEVNYYPASNGWAYMWSNFDPAAIDRDFARVHSLGANTVRIFIQPSVFGYPVVHPVMANRLAEVIGLAAKHSLRLQLTLFDIWSDFTDISGSQEWVSSLLSRYGGDPRIAVVELHNEINPQNPQAVAWVARMLPYLATVLPGTLRTVSVPNVPAQVFALFTRELRNSPPDFWDYHYYGPTWKAYDFLRQIQSIAAPRPLFIGEVGYSTGGDDAGDQAAMAQAQAAYYQDIFGAAAALGLPSPAPWTLNDFSPQAIPPGQKTGMPGQFDYGLFQVNGTPKPAAAVVRAAFSGTVSDSIDGDFEHESLASRTTIAGTWQVANPTTAAYAISHSVAHSGTASAEISGSGNAAVGETPYFYATPVQPVRPGASWTASAWAQGTGTSGTVQIALVWRDGSGHNLGRVTSASLPDGDTAWTRLTVGGTAPPGAATVLVLLETIDDVGTAWFDGVSAGPATGTAAIGPFMGLLDRIGILLGNRLRPARQSVGAPDDEVG